MQIIHVRVLVGQFSKFGVWHSRNHLRNEEMNQFLAHLSRKCHIFGYVSTQMNTYTKPMVDISLLFIH